MKKFLLSAVALVAAMSANAQVFKVSADAEGIGSDAVTVSAGKAWGSIEGVLDISNPFETGHKKVDCKNNDYVKVVIDGNEIVTGDGVQGQDNPKDADGGNSANTLKEAASGAVIQLDAKKDGWVYIVAKLSTNKQYVVFEEGSAMGYKIAMEVKDDRFPTNKINLEIKGEGEYNYIPASVAQPDGPGIQWVVKEALGDPDAATAGNGLGVFYFPVAKTCKYYAHATGSKISWTGIYFSETEAASVKVVKEDGTEFALVGDAAGISTVKANVENNSAIYNLAGQKVAKDYKGLVIKNGVKMIQK